MMRMDKQIIVALINLGAIAVPLGVIKRDMRKAEKTIGNTEILHVPATPESEEK
jgi:hypothetical protein